MEKIAKLSKHVLVAAAIAFTPVSIAAGGPENFRLRLQQASLYGGSSSYEPGLYVSIGINTYVESSGVASGAVDLQWLDENGWWHAMVCSGPQLANALTVHHATGETRVYATLDPSSASCYGTDSSPLTLELSGHAIPDYYDSANVVGKRREGTSVFRYNLQQDCFGVNLEGTLPLPQVTGLTAGACTYRQH